MTTSRQRLGVSTRDTRAADDELAAPAAVRVAPGKLTSADVDEIDADSGGEPGKLSRLDVDPYAMSPEAALRYARAIDRKAEPGADDVGDGALASAFGFLDDARGGQPLPERLRRRFERALQCDLRDVRIHVDARAARAAACIRARAFTVGRDIYFAAGAYDPSSAVGLELIAHEVAHVATARGSQRGPSRSADSHEQVADAFAQAFVDEPTDGLPRDVRADMEEAFGADFSEVRVHEGPEASARGAIAFTQGTHIHFRPGAYDPHSSEGRRLLGHELAHVVQQARGSARHADAAQEREADEQGQAAARGHRVEAAAPAIRAATAGPAQHKDPEDFSGVPFWVENYLIAVLEQPVPEGDQKKADARFELVLAGARGLIDEGRHALLARLAHPRADDKLVTLLRGKLHHASLERLQKQLREPVGEAKATVKAPTQPQQPDAKSPMDFGEASREVKKLGRVQAPKGVYLQARPIPNAPHTSETILPFDAEVFVTRETLQPGAHDRWCYIVGVEHNASGFVPEMYIAVDPPDPASHLHRVTKGETLGQIATAAYGKNFSGGNDQRLYVQGLYEANKDRAGVHLDKVDLSWTTTWHREEAEEETLKVYRGVKILEGTSLWIPSDAFIQRLKSMGAITSGSSDFSKLYRAAKDLVNDAVEAVKYIAGFVVGLLEGAFDAIKDLFVGAAEMIAAVVEVVWNLITGDLGAIKKMLTGWVNKMKQVWEHRGEIADEFMKKWNAPDGWDRGRFQGEVLGWVMMTVFLILVTMGEDAPAAVAGIVNKWPALVKLLQVVDAAGDIGTYLGAAMKTVRAGAKLPMKAVDAVASRAAKKGAKVADHVVEDVGKDAGRLERKGEHAADEEARAITKDKPKTETTSQPLDGHGEFTMEFMRDLSPTARGIARQLEKRGWVRVAEIAKEDLVQISKWFDREVAVVQSPYGKLRIVLGEKTGILQKQLMAGEVFVAHTHPVLRSVPEHFAKDLEKAGKHVECVIDWSGNVIFYSKAGIKNPRNPGGWLEPLRDYEAAFMNKDGTIVGFSKVDIVDGASGTHIKVRE